VPVHDNVIALDPVRRPETHEPLPRLLVAWHDEVSVLDPSLGRDEFAEAGQFLYAEIVEEQVVPGVEGNPEVPRPGDRLRAIEVLPSVRQVAELRVEERAVPFQGERARHQHMVVLEEFSERHQDFSEVRDDANPRREAFRGFGVRDFDEVARIEHDQRPFDPVARRDRPGLPRAFRLDLRADRDEVVEDVHRRRMKGERSEARGPGAAVSQAQPARPTRVAEDRPARDDVLNEHLARLDTQFVLHLLGP